MRVYFGIPEPRNVSCHPGGKEPASWGKRGGGRSKQHHHFLGCGFKDFLFSPQKLGKIPILTNIFQRGWFNHQLDHHFGLPQPFGTCENDDEISGAIDPSNHRYRTEECHLRRGSWRLEGKRK